MRKLLLGLALCLPMSIQAGTYESLVSDTRNSFSSDSSFDNAFSPAAAQAPTLQSGGGSKQFASGTCMASAGSSKTCNLKDSSWYCSSAGGAALGQSEGGQVFLQGSTWKAQTWRGGWGGRIYWSCFK